MLTPAQVRRIYRGGRSINHDYWFGSLLAGEPFLQEGLICYFDGRAATVCGFPLEGDDEPDTALLRRVAKGWTRGRSAEEFLYIGPQPVDFGNLRESGFRRVCLHARTQISAELALDCPAGSQSPPARRVLDRAFKNGLTVKIHPGGIVSAEHMRLTERFYEKRKLSGYLASVAFALQTALRSQRVRIIEAWKNGSLRGYVAVHRAFADTMVGLFLAHDETTKGVADFLYREMLELADRESVSRVNVGPSPSRGHYEFKKKWGGRIDVPPYYLVEWTRGPLARRRFTSWGPRLVKL